MNMASLKGKRFLAMLGLILMIFLVSLDQTVVGTAMPRVIADLRGFELYAWVTTIYLLAQTAIIPIAGKLGDMYGRKPVAIAGVVIFLIGSWMCGFAPNMWWLIGARGIQGIGAGAIFSTVFTLIADIIPNPAERAKYQGIFFAVFSISSVIGPLVGGAITDTLGWRWVFYVNVPIGILSLAVLPFVLPNTERRARGRVDVLGAIVSIVGVVSILMAFTWVGEGQAWTSPQVLGGFLVGLIAVAVFIPIELRAQEPIIPLSLFKNRAISAITVMMFLNQIAMFGIILYTPLFLQGVLGLSASTSGTVLIPMVLTMTLGSVVGGQIISRFGQVRPFLIFGAVAVTVGAGLLAMMSFTTSVWAIAGYMFIVGLGLGLLLPNSTLAVQTVVEPRNIGVATSATQFVRMIGATVGTALMGSFVAAGYANALAANMPPGVTSELAQAIHNPDALVSPDALLALERVANTLPNGTVLMQALLDVARHALAEGVQQGFIMVTVTSALGILVALMIPHINLKQRHTGPVMAMEGGVVEGGAPAPSE